MKAIDLNMATGPYHDELSSKIPMLNLSVNNREEHSVGESKLGQFGISLTTDQTFGSFMHNAEKNDCWWSDNEEDGSDKSSSIQTLHTTAPRPYGGVTPGREDQQEKVCVLYLIHPPVPPTTRLHTRVVGDRHCVYALRFSLWFRK
jgi:hypothetical protein